MSGKFARYVPLLCGTWTISIEDIQIARIALNEDGTAVFVRGQGRDVAGSWNLAESEYDGAGGWPAIVVDGLPLGSDDNRYQLTSFSSQRLTTLNEGQRCEWQKQH